MARARYRLDGRRIVTAHEAQQVRAGNAAALRSLLAKAEPCKVCGRRFLYSEADQHTPAAHHAIGIPDGRSRTRSTSRKDRWSDVHAAEKAGHPMAHPLRHVFGE
jgi:hypothetical protein